MIHLCMQEMEDLLIQMKAQSQALAEEQNEQTKQLSSALSEVSVQTQTKLKLTCSFRHALSTKGLVMS